MTPFCILCAEPKSLCLCSKEVLGFADAHIVSTDGRYALIDGETLKTLIERAQAWGKIKSDEILGKPSYVSNAAPQGSVSRPEIGNSRGSDGESLPDSPTDDLTHPVSRVPAGAAPSGMALMAENSPSIRDTIMRLMRDHYWDSLEPQKDLILLHIERTLKWFGPPKHMGDELNEVTRSAFNDSGELKRHDD